MCNIPNNLGDPPHLKTCLGKSSSSFFICVGPYVESSKLVMGPNDNVEGLDQGHAT